ncbi:hypothetical protein [uncultured Clostridium sp.]|uniref:hypothetical protein n=1 Tax=uncultured Clostridium sp. TaxID=59620 RepID=UPI0026038798|nr:hypothetical protein [uncultured Clostridium sp.]
MKNVDKDKLPEDIKRDLEKIENDKIDKQLSGDLKIDNLDPKGNISILETKKVKTENKSTEELLDIEEVVEEDNDLVIKLKNPRNGIEEIVLNPDNINGTSLSKIEKMWRSKNRENRETVKELDGEYLAMVAAVLSGVAYSTIMSLGGYDFTQVTFKTRNFLLVD